jgi:hypothetical protein
MADRHNPHAGALESGTVTPQAEENGTNHRHPRRAFGPVIVHFVELQIAMGTGALLCLLAGRLVAESSPYAAVYHPGSGLYALGDIVFLTTPVFAWMTWRGRTRRLRIEISMAMIAPVGLVAVAGEIMGTDYLHWLVTGMYPVMSVGIAIFMLYRRKEFEGPWAREVVLMPPPEWAHSGTFAARHQSGNKPRSEEPRAIEGRGQEGLSGSGD